VTEPDSAARPTTMLLRTRAELSPLLTRWAALHTETRSDNPFTHPAWCTAWLDCYRPEHPRALVDQDSSGRIRALAPFVASGLGRLHWVTLGGPHIDFGAPLTFPGNLGATAFVELLNAYRSRWSSVTLNGVDEDVARALNTVGPSSRVAFQRVGAEICPRVEVPSFDGWAEELPRGRWKKLATARRRVHAQPGFSRTLVEAPPEICAAVRSFDTLRLQSWWQRGRLHELAPAIRSTQHREFLLLAVRRMAEHGLASVIELRLSGRLAASSVLFWSADTVLVALKATDTRMSASLSPGLVLDLHTIELAAARGVHRVDFGRGDEPYKFGLGARPHLTYQLIASRPGARLPLVRAGLRRHLDDIAYQQRMRRTR
jgi:CelD/BcsL family acetyltransferase involved in cellulose biosynthesis